jgi:lysophospholipase L1-like esterase
MRNILLFGDSNTWGAKPLRELTKIERYEFVERYGGVLQEELGNEYRIIEEGNPGRTTVWEDPIEGYKSGKEYLIPCLVSHQPLDLVVIMLGTNDIKGRFSLSAFDVAQGAGVLVSMVQSWIPSVGKSPEILLIAPPPIKEPATFFQSMFADGVEKSKHFAKEFKKVAAAYSCEIFYAADVIEASEVDGIHYEKSEHKKLGEVLAKRIRKILQ